MSIPFTGLLPILPKFGTKNFLEIVPAFVLYSALLKNELKAKPKAKGARQGYSRIVEKLRFVDQKICPNISQIFIRNCPIFCVRKE
jgi:hypothetical protein